MENKMFVQPQEQLSKEAWEILKKATKKTPDGKRSGDHNLSKRVPVRIGGRDDSYNKMFESSNPFLKFWRRLKQCFQ